MGAYVPGALHDVTGSYDLALLGGVAVLVLATLASAALPDPRRGTGAATTVPAPSPA